MDDERTLSGAEAEQWYETFEASDGFEAVFDAAALTIEPDDLDRESVTRKGDDIHVQLYYTESEGDYVRASGVFDAESGDLREASIDDGVIAAPLCGHGDVWTYRDGDIEKTRWLS